MRRWIRGAAAIMMASAVFTAAAAQAAAKFPEPTASFYVNDYAGVIEEDTEAKIVEYGSRLDAETGAQVVLVTVDFVGDMDISDYAADLFNEWGIGDADKDNGLLIVMSIGDDDYWAVQGRGLETLLTSGTISDLLYYELEPHFAARDYDAGAESIYGAFIKQLGGVWGDSAGGESSGVAVPTAPPGGTVTAPIDEQPGSEEGGSGVNWFVVIVIILILIFIFSRPGGGRRGGTRYGGPVVRGPMYPPRRYYRPPPVMPPPPPPPPKRPSSGGGWFGGGSSSGSGGSSGGGLFGGGGGSTRGGGAGRSSGGGSRGGWGGGSFGGGGGSRGGGGFGGGGGFRGGGGSTRGGGAGRRK